MVSAKKRSSCATDGEQVARVAGLIRWAVRCLRRNARSIGEARWGRMMWAGFRRGRQGRSGRIRGSIGHPADALQAA